jgi:hypothetical protein
VAQQVGVGAAGVFEGVGQQTQMVWVERAVWQSAVVIGGATN